MVAVDGVAYVLEDTLRREFGASDVNGVLRDRLLPHWCGLMTARLSWWGRVKFWWALMRGAAGERETMGGMR